MNRNPVPSDLNTEINRWIASCEATLHAREQAGSRVLILRFEDLLGNTERTMRRISTHLGISFHTTLLEPTFNGLPIKGNSVFEVKTFGITKDPLDRTDALSADERQQIDCKARSLYEKLLPYCG